MDSDKATFLKQYFDWKDWLTKSYHLRSSANLLHDKIIETRSKRSRDIDKWQFNLLSTIGPALHLTGLSIENLVKSKIIHDFVIDNEFPDRGDFDSEEIFLSVVNQLEEDFKKFRAKNNWNTKGGHGIYDMLHISNIDFSESQYNFIKRAEVYLIWSGKYFFPTIKQYSNYKSQSDLQGYNFSDKQTFNEIFQSIKETLPDHKVDFT